MQRIIDEVGVIARRHKPVGTVGTTEYEGSSVVGIVFNDGEGMSEPGDFNKLMKEVSHLSVTVAALSDRELRELGLAVPIADAAVRTAAEAAGF